MPMVSPFNGYVETIATVSSTSLVSIERNKYSVPCQYANQKLSLRLYPERLEAHDEDGCVAMHTRSFDRNQVCYDWRHYIVLLERKPGALRNGAPFESLPESLQRLRSALLKREGGDRLMAQTLSCVPTHGLEAVVVAVQLLLESGNTSAEHIQNVLSRLNEPMPPTPMQTHLCVKEEPIADSGRYDRLLVTSTAEVRHDA